MKPKQTYSITTVFILILISMTCHAARETLYYPEDLNKENESESALARFYPGKDVKIISIDGGKDNYKSVLFKRPVKNDQVAVLLRPGKHSIVYEYKKGNGDQKLREFDAESGKTYYLHHDTFKEPNSVSSSVILLSWIDEFKQDSPEYERSKAGKYCFSLKYSEVQIKECEKAANLGDSVAQYRVGWQYYKGQGIEKNYDKALTWFYKAAENRYPLALYSIGSMFEKGEGVSVNYKRAIEWYQKGAEQGNTLSMFALGGIFIFGKSGVKDRESGIKWFLQAASRGDPLALYYLGLIYYDDDFGIRDLVKSYSFLDAATRIEWSEKVFKLKEKVASEMSQEQKRESENIAAVMLKKLQPEKTLNLCISQRDLSVPDSGEKAEISDISDWSIRINHGNIIDMNNNTPLFMRLPAENKHYFTGFYQGKKLDLIRIPPYPDEDKAVCLYLNRSKNAWRMRELSSQDTLESCGCYASRTMAELKHD